MARLVADIGGTNARFALTGGGAAGEGGRVAVTHERHLRVQDFPGLAEAALSYLAGLPAPRPAVDAAVIAVATPVDARVIRFTNSPWSFTRDALAGALGLAVDRLAVINDFAAQAAAIPHLGVDDSIAIGGGTARPGWPIAVIGPGTGLGAAGLVPTGNGPVVVASEGGHVSFAPHDELELEILRRLIARFGHVSNERVISGPGLVTLAMTMAEISGRLPVKARPEDVTAAAAGGASPAAAEVAGDALRVFSGLLGAAAGDLALAFGAKGGVYLCGGLCGKLGRFFDHVRFRERFEAKGRLGPFLADVPCRQVSNPQTGLIGAAVHPLGE